MARATDILRDHLARYREQSATSPATPSVDAVDRSDFEEVIAYGQFIYDRIKRLDDELSEQLATAGRKPDLADAVAVQALYASWASRARENLRAARELELTGHKVEGLDAFRTAYRDALAILSLPAERVNRAASEPARPRSTGELRDELRRHVDAHGRSGLHEAGGDRPLPG